jgi:hypothetical protein
LEKQQPVSVLNALQITLKFLEDDVNGNASHDEAGDFHNNNFRETHDVLEAAVCEQPKLQTETCLALLDLTRADLSQLRTLKRVVVPQIRVQILVMEVIDLLGVFAENLCLALDDPLVTFVVVIHCVLSAQHRHEIISGVAHVGAWISNFSKVIN